MNTEIRKYVIPVMVVSFAGLAEWLGEDGHHSNITLLIAAVAGAVLAGSFMPSKSKGMRKLLFVISAIVISMVLVIGGWAVGSSIAQRAFNECVDDGDKVVQRLQEFKAKNGSYPSTLVELHGSLPGNRLLRANILYYTRTESGFVLEFSDWLVSHTTDESGKWNVNK